MIGVFDSGVGGLSVLTRIRETLPRADLLYVADRARSPFGTRTLVEVEAISLEIADWLLDRGADTLVVACNTASAAALDSLRQTHPGVPIVGMEPAVKPAVARSRSRKVAVFATSATFQGTLFDSVVSRFAADVEVVARACPEWVDLVERGHVNGTDVEGSVRPVVERVIEHGADVIVLGCTHFSFLAPVIRQITDIEVIDPAPAIAAQTARVAPTSQGHGTVTLAASGNPDELAELARALTGISAAVIPFGP